MDGATLYRTIISTLKLNKLHATHQVCTAQANAEDWTSQLSHVGMLPSAKGFCVGCRLATAPAGARTCRRSLSTTTQHQAAHRSPTPRCPQVQCCTHSEFLSRRCFSVCIAAPLRPALGTRHGLQKFAGHHCFCKYSTTCLDACAQMIRAASAASSTRCPALRRVWSGLLTTLATSWTWSSEFAGWLQ